MSESVIFSSPILLALYGIALAITLFEKWKRTGAMLMWTAAIITMTAAGLSLIMGADLVEIAAVIVVFLIVNLAGQKEGDG